MKLGHKNLKTTEIYTKFNMALIQSHHPSIKSTFLIKFDNMGNKTWGTNIFNLIFNKQKNV